MKTVGHKDRLATCFGKVIPVALCVVAALVGCFNPIGRLVAAEAKDIAEVMQVSERSVVKLYGAGGMRGLESYQSGILIDDGETILTSWSTVLDVDKVRVVTYDGRRLNAELLGVDPECEIALLKVPNTGLPGFRIDPSAGVRPGQRVFAISNLFGIASGNETCSFQKGVVMGVSKLQSNGAILKTIYRGKVIVIDVMSNNPGATGGALIDLSGRLVGMIGKELRDEQSGIWLNYALPMEVIQGSIERIKTGKTRDASTLAKGVKDPHTPSDLGLVMVPDVLAKTPAYIDRVRPGSLAEKAGVQSNDLILFVNDQRVDSQKGLDRILQTIQRNDSFSILVQRGNALARVQVRP